MHYIPISPEQENTTKVNNVVCLKHKKKAEIIHWGKLAEINCPECADEELMQYIEGKYLPEGA